MKIYIVVTKKVEADGCILEENIDKIEIFNKAEDAISFYEENHFADIITRELEV